MIYRVIFLCAFILLCFTNVSNAQLTSQKEASYFAVIKAVADYKIDDEENKTKIQQLREDTRFNDKLNKMMQKLSNSKSKDAKNKRIYNILRQAGKQIYDELN